MPHRDNTIRKLDLVWRSMKYRCSDPNHRAYPRYGGRGISVSGEWKYFANFVKWAMANGYQEGLTLERINNDLGYGPGNCKWATWREQNNNTSQNLLVTISGQTKTLTQWCRQYNRNFYTAWSRIDRGWRPEDAVLQPSRTYRMKA